MLSFGRNEKLAAISSLAQSHIMKILPEFTAFTNIWSRYNFLNKNQPKRNCESGIHCDVGRTIKMLREGRANNAAIDVKVTTRPDTAGLSTVDMTDDVVVSTSDNKVEDLVEVKKVSSTQDGVELLVATAKSFHAYVRLIPTSLMTFDFCRLLDDVVLVRGDADSTEVTFLLPSDSENLRTEISTLITELLVTMKRASELKKCRWIGSKEDTGKLITNVLVNQNWRDVLKVGPLCKVLLLSSVPDATARDGEKIMLSAQSLLQEVIAQSQLFVGCGVVDLELLAEFSSWLSGRGRLAHRLAQCQLFEFCIKLAYHWNVELCQLAALSTSAVSNSIVPVSPVLMAALCLSLGNFGVFNATLPNNIKQHMNSQLSQYDIYTGDRPFFGKFEAGLQRALRHKTSRVLVEAALLLSGMKSPVSYADVLRDVTNRLVVEAEGGGWVTEVISMLNTASTGSLDAGWKDSDDQEEQSMLTYFASLVTTVKPAKKAAKRKPASVEIQEAPAADSRTMTDLMNSRLEMPSRSVSAKGTALTATRLPACLKACVGAEVQPSDRDSLTALEALLFAQSDLFAVCGMASCWLRAAHSDGCGVNDVGLVLDWVHAHVIRTIGSAGQVLNGDRSGVLLVFSALQLLTSVHSVLLTFETPSDRAALTEKVSSLYHDLGKLLFKHLRDQSCPLMADCIARCFSLEELTKAIRLLLCATSEAEKSVIRDFLCSAQDLSSGVGPTVVSNIDQLQLLYSVIIIKVVMMLPQDPSIAAVLMNALQPLVDTELAGMVSKASDEDLPQLVLDLLLLVAIRLDQGSCAAYIGWSSESHKQFRSIVIKLLTRSKTASPFSIDASSSDSTVGCVHNLNATQSFMNKNLSAEIVSQGLAGQMIGQVASSSNAFKSPSGTGSSLLMSKSFTFDARKVSFYSDSQMLSNETEDDVSNFSSVTGKITAMFEDPGDWSSVLPICSWLGPLLRSQPFLCRALANKLGEDTIFVRCLWGSCLPNSLHSVMSEGIDKETISTCELVSKLESQWFPVNINSNEIASAEVAQIASFLSALIDSAKNVALAAPELSFMTTASQVNKKLPGYVDDLFKAFASILRGSSSSFPSTRDLWMNLCVLAFQHADKPARLLDFFSVRAPAIVLEHMLQATQQQSFEHWKNLFVSYFHCLVEVSAGLLSAQESGNLAIASGVVNGVLRELSHRLQALLLMCLVKQPISSITFSSVEIKAMRAKLNKYVKSVLKYGIDVEDVLSIFSNLMKSVYDSHETDHNNQDSKRTVWDLVFAARSNSDDGADMYFPEQLVDMIAGHSKFPACLHSSASDVSSRRTQPVTETGDHKGKELNAALLQLILWIISRLPFILSRDGNHGNSNDNKAKDNIDSCKMIMTALQPLYGGSLAVTDRIILRIWHILSTHAGLEPTSSHQGKSKTFKPLYAPIGAVLIGCRVLTSAPLPHTSGVVDISRFGDKAKTKSGGKGDDKDDNKKKRKFGGDNAGQQTSQKGKYIKTAGADKDAVDEADAEATVVRVENSCWLFSFFRLSTIHATITQVVENAGARTLIPKAMDCEGFTSIQHYLKERHSQENIVGKEWNKTKKVDNRAGNKPVAPMQPKSAVKTKNTQTVQLDNADSDSEDLSSDEMDEDEDEDDVDNDSDENMSVDEDGKDSTELIRGPFNRFTRLFPLFDGQRNVLTSDAEAGTNIPRVFDIDHIGSAVTKGSQTVVYDLSFVLPCLLNILRVIPTMSVKQLARQGLLSLVFVSLCADCVVLRAYALCILEMLFIMLDQQTVEMDPTFRERPQYLILFQFVRNAIDLNVVDPRTNTCGPVKIPSSVAIFLAKASLTLQQPSNELYPKINKYMLSKPCMDVKDFPMFDVVFASLLEHASAVAAATTTDQNSTDDQATANAVTVAVGECLLALRFIRDGLNTKVDHANLCRKNCYNRLMLLFPLLVTNSEASGGPIGADAKLIGNVLLDVFERALSMCKESARYLLDKCNFIAWIANHLTTAQLDSVSSVFGYRCFQLLRRAANALCLLTVDAFASMMTARAGNWLANACKSFVTLVQTLVDHRLAVKSKKENTEVRELVELMRDTNNLCALMSLCGQLGVDPNNSASTIPWTCAKLQRLCAQALASRVSSAEIVALGATNGVDVHSSDSLLSLMCSPANLSYFLGWKIPSSRSEQQMLCWLPRIDAFERSSDKQSTLLSILHAPESVQRSVGGFSRMDAQDAVEICWKSFRHANFQLQQQQQNAARVQNDEALLSMCLHSVLQQKSSSLHTILHTQLSDVRWLLLMHNHYGSSGCGGDKDAASLFSSGGDEHATLMHRVTTVLLIALLQCNEVNASSLEDARALLAEEKQLLCTVLSCLLGSGDSQVLPSWPASLPADCCQYLLIAASKNCVDGIEGSHLGGSRDDEGANMGFWVAELCSAAAQYVSLLVTLMDRGDSRRDIGDNRRLLENNIHRAVQQIQNLRTNPGRPITVAVGDSYHIRKHSATISPASKLVVPGSKHDRISKKRAAQALTSTNIGSEFEEAKAMHAATERSTSTKEDADKLVETFKAANPQGSLLSLQSMFRMPTSLTPKRTITVVTEDSNENDGNAATGIKRKVSSAETTATDTGLRKKKGKARKA
jgi:hypothetical protein